MLLFKVTVLNLYVTIMKPEIKLIILPDSIKLQLHDPIYQLRLYSSSLIHIISLSNSHNNLALIQKNRGDKSHRVIVALGYNYTVRFIAPILLY